MGLSPAMQQVINDMYMNPAVAAEHIAILNTASNLAQAPRIALASTSLSPQSDYRVLLNSPSGSPVVSLPAGINGQSFAVAFHPSNVSTWTMAPNGSDVLGAGVALAMSSSNPVNVQYLNGSWFKV